MICPKCGKDTPTIFNSCQNCKVDLRQFHESRNKALEGTGDAETVPGFEMESQVLNWGPVGGVILMVGAAVWFFGARAAGIIFFYPPVLFLIGLVGFITGIHRTIARKRSKEKLKEMAEKFTTPTKRIMKKN